MTHRFLVGIAVLALLVVGCATRSPHEKIMDRMFDTMEDAVIVLESVKDVPSAERAREELARLGERKRALREEAMQLGLPSEDSSLRLEAKARTRFDRLRERTVAAMTRIEAMPEVAAALRGTLAGVRPTRTGSTGGSGSGW